MRPYPTIWQSIGLLFYFFLLSIPIILPFLIFHVTEKGILYSVAYVLGFVGLIWIGLKKRNNFSFSKAPFPPVVLGVSFLFLMSFHFTSQPLQELLPEPEGLTNTLDEMMRYPVLSVLVIAVLAPLLEEILIRGIILDGYLKNYSPIKSILASALLFALIHGNLSQGIGAFLMGIVVGVIYWRTQSLLFCICLHMANNSTTVLLYLLIDRSVASTQSVQEMIGNDLIYWSIYLISLFIMIGCAWYLWYRYVRPAYDQLLLKPTLENALPNLASKA